MTVQDSSAGHARVAILGGGNVGQALARGWAAAGRFAPAEIMLTRRQVEKLGELADAGFKVGSDNRAAVEQARQIVVAVQPQQLRALLQDIRPALDPQRHTLVSVASGVRIEQIRELAGEGVPIVRAMPNTAIAIGESMTCLAAPPEHAEALQQARTLFDSVGVTLEINESMMEPATALCACGTAFFLRSIRAASQGGIEIGFHPEEALLMAAQTAKGAAGLLLREGSHPEAEIDRVTTPRGCTIAGLNEMEHRGFSSALIKGILTSARKAVELYREPAR
ncbi:MAG TPA: pyrroline-5-carboxylate reductase [Woeseiaceae bacterium]|nr:pyrroline-5-carboxylate reductase [Woeseiaceae bacterium]